MKTRTGDPWMPASDYGRALPAFTVNLLVRDIPRAVEFQRRVLAATVHYSDGDFAPVNVGGVELRWCGAIGAASAPSCVCSAWTRTRSRNEPASTARA